MLDSTNLPTGTAGPEPVVTYPDESTGQPESYPAVEEPETTPEPTEPAAPSQPIGYPAQPAALPTQPAAYPVDPETSETATEPASPLTVTFPDEPGPKAEPLP